MKDWTLLIWIPQFGIAVVFPLIGFIMLAVWLHNSVGLGSWIIAVGIVFGLITAGVGFRDTVTAMMNIADKKSEHEEGCVSYNDHS